MNKNKNGTYIDDMKKKNSGRDFLDAIPMDQCYYVCDEISKKYKKYARVKYIYDHLNERRKSPPDDYYE
tara:strand:+ start:175 stop:381 length:207 start_codon:yes stop_codon:yes gene_type:complete